jgi:hypothetical protein
MTRFLRLKQSLPSPREIMKWLFRFAESQENVDWVVRWLGRIAVGVGLIGAIVLVVAIIQK